MFDPTTDQPTPENPTTHPVVPGLDILDVVASGGHGTVYRARQEEHDRVVALKVLDARFADETTRRRFDRERVALGRISDHPSIVSLLDSGYTAEGSPYLLLEFAPGGSLADRIVSGPVGFDEATTIVIGLAAAAERTHTAGVVHRDIKPANVLRSAYDDWMLTDFGIASLLDRSATGVVHASYAHTAPETFDGNTPTPVSDVYSLASVLATCLTGEEPFAMTSDEAAVSVMRRVMSEPYPDLRRSGVDDDVASLLEMALSKEPMQRPVSARAFAAALNDLRVAHGLMPIVVRTGEELSSNSTVLVDRDEAVAAAASNWSSEPEESTHEFRSPKRRFRVLVAAVVVMLAGFGVSFGLQTLSGDDDGIPLASAIVDVFDGETNNGPNNGGAPADVTNAPDGDAPVDPVAANQPVAADDNGGPGNGNGGGGDGNGGPGNGGGGDGNGGPGNGGGGNGGPGNGGGGNGGPGNGGGGNGNGGPGNGGGGNGNGQGGN